MYGKIVKMCCKNLANQFEKDTGKMDINAYLRTSLSPYRLNDDAMNLITALQKSFSVELERKIIIVLNAAELHPSMSSYQLSLTHKALGDCYYEHSYYGSAWEQYNRAIALNKNLSVKRRMKKISSMPSTERKVSLSADLVDDVLQFPEYIKLVENDEAERNSELNQLWKGHEAERQRSEAIQQQLAEEARLEDLIFDPEYEAEIARKLEILGEPYKSEFYRVREVRSRTLRLDDSLSLKKYDLLTLRSMWKTKEYHDKKWSNSGTLTIESPKDSE